MEASDDFEDINLVEEGLKIIINLSRFKECGALSDFYEIGSQNISDLTEPEKNLLGSILKAEFT